MFYSCNKKTTEKEDFYTYSKTYDLYRLPLIEPFQLISADRGHSWNFELPYKQIDVIDNHVTVENAAVSNKIIILYTPVTYVNGAMEEAWFVIDTENKTEKAFTDEAGYLAHLRKLGMQNTKLRNVKEMYKLFDSTGKLPQGWPKEQHGD